MIYFANEIGRLWRQRPKVPGPLTPQMRHKCAINLLSWRSILGRRVVDEVVDKVVGRSNNPIPYHYTR